MLDLLSLPMASVNRPAIPPKVARFGAYEADPRSGELRKSGMRLKIGLQPFQVLFILLEKRGEVVTREELREQIWPSGTFVDFENGLNKAVAKLRGILNDDPLNPRFIETVPRRGYRFVAGVEFLEPGTNSGATLPLNDHGDGARILVAPGLSPDILPAADRPGQAGNSQSKTKADAASFSSVSWFGLSSTFMRHAAWVVLAAALAGAGIIVYSQRHARPSDLRSAIHSIAVLPFDNVSGDLEKDYFAAGMTNEMVKNLSRIASLRVVSPVSASRFKHTGEPLGQLGREMGVDAVIEGSSALAGDKVRLTVRLFDVSSNEYLWAGDYHNSVGQLLAAQEEITQTIAQQIRLQLTAQAKTSRPVHIPVAEAYEAYLEGRYYYYHWGNRWTMVWWKKSCDSFQRAIQLDLVYAPAYAGLAECFTAMNYTGMEVPEKDRVPPDKALAMANKALELDDALAEAHAALGTIYLNDWQWARAFTELKKAVELQPNDSQLRFRLAGYYRTVGSMRQAVEEAEEAKRLDPGSASTTASLGWMYFNAGSDGQAESEFKNATVLEPGSVPALRGLFEIYNRQDKHAEAITTLGEFLSSTRHPDRAKRMLEIYQKVGYRRAVEYVLREEIQDDYHENAKPFYLASDFARLGDKEKALAYLEQAYAGHAPQMKLLRANQDFASVASDPRFQNILKKLRLDDASVTARN